MSRQTQQPIISVLLLWTTLLSITQTVFIILFFTSGHRVPNNSTAAPERTVQSAANLTTLLRPRDNENLKGQMLTFKASKENGFIDWVPKEATASLVADGGKNISIKNDGYYFLSLQVTLKTSQARCPCSGTMRSGCMVSLAWNKNNILQGGIHADTCSTGLLAKVQPLPGGSMLTVTLPVAEFDATESLTHLDIIYIVRP